MAYQIKEINDWIDKRCEAYNLLNSKGSYFRCTQIIDDLIAFYEGPLNSPKLKAHKTYFKAKLFEIEPAFAKVYFTPTPRKKKSKQSED